MGDITLKAMPFDSNEILNPATGETTFDRVAYSRDLADWLRTYISNGILVQGGDVLGSQLKVLHKEALTCTVKAGAVCINGRTGWLEADTDITVEMGGAQARVDRLVAELNIPNDRGIYIKTLKGTPAAEPAPPSLTQTEDVYQIPLAQVRVNAGSAVVASVTDERQNYISNVTIGIKPPTGMDAVTVQLSPETTSLYAANNVDGALKSLRRQGPSNLTLFKIPTIDNISGEPIVGINFSITGSIAPTVTNYVTNSDGYLYVLLPYGYYTLTFTDSLIGYDSSPLAFSSVSGEPYKALNTTLFRRLTQKRYVMDVTKEYKKAPYIKTIDAFLVGGGGAGGGATNVSSSVSGGGGGGYVASYFAIDVSSYSTFSPTIGAGGIGVVGSNGGSGGATSFLGRTVNGGQGGLGGASNYAGGSGGSGGGGASAGDQGGAVGGAGGTDGGSGGNGTGTTPKAGGSGQGITTKEFGETSGVLYSGGGGGGGYAAGGTGGGGGGGNGSGSGGNGTAATFYGGGGGGCCGNSTGNRIGGTGYKGCIVIRWN